MRQGGAGRWHTTQNVALALATVVLLALLALLGMHLHGADPITHVNAQATSSAVVAATSAPQTPEPGAPATAQPGVEDPAPGPAISHIEFVTACMLALMLASALLAPALRTLRRQAARVVSRVRHQPLCPTPLGQPPLRLQLSISRT